MQNDTLTEHIEEDSFFPLAMDEITQVLPRERKDIFLTHLKECSECSLKFSETKRKLDLLQRAFVGEDIPLSNELSYLGDKNFVDGMIQRFKDLQSSSKQQNEQQAEPAVVSGFSWKHAFAVLTLVFVGIVIAWNRGWITFFRQTGNQPILTNSNNEANGSNLHAEVGPSNQNANNDLTVSPTPFEQRAENSELADDLKTPVSPTNKQSTSTLETYGSTGATMGNNDFEEFVVKKQISTVAINLPITRQMSLDYREFNIKLESAPGFVRETKKVVKSKRGLAVRILVPASLLQNGDNAISLSGIDRKGAVDELEGYTLRIKKQ